MEYRHAAGEKLELKRIGESEEIGKKKDTWIYCRPDCGRQESVLGVVTFENNVLTLVQTGWVTP